MLNWEKIGKTVHANGETEILYQCGDLLIESRKRAIPHAGGRGGFWYHTTYFFIQPEGDETEYYSMKDAKEAAEIYSRVKQRLSNGKR